MHTFFLFILFQVEVASEGISAATKISGTAASCLAYMKALSIDQLRWIYSNYDEDELTRTGWDSSSVLFLDGNPDTHLWSELDSRCAEEEIMVGGPAKGTEGSFELFSELIFQGQDETFDFNREGSFLNATQGEDLVDFIIGNEAAIAYFGLAYILTDLDQELVHLVSIKVDDNVIIDPRATSFEDGSYPLARHLYMNLLDGNDSLELTRPFLDFGFSPAGDEALKSVGYWPIYEPEKVLMATRIQSSKGVPLEAIQSSCGPADGAVTIAGSSTVFPVALIWSQIYKLGCDVSFTVEGGGSSVGAGRVCDNPVRGAPVDIGDMSREWKTSEADMDDFLYSCLEPGDPERSAIQIDVAIDGLTVAVQEGGAASKCIQILGGLKIDQLRWIYSDYTDVKLEETGWDPKSLKNSDSNSQTHLWSELDASCDRIEIRIAGADDLSGTFEYFKETVFEDGETFDFARPGFGYTNSEDDEELVSYLQEFGEAISYFGYAYYYENQDSISAVPIQNSDGDFLLPTEKTIGDGSYNPLARRIFMNLLNDDESLKDTAPFVKFGLLQTELVASTGYVALPQEDIDEMIRRLNDGNAHSAFGSDDDDDGLSGGAIAGIAIGGTLGLCLIAFVIFFKLKNSGDDKNYDPDKHKGPRYS